MSNLRGIRYTVIPSSATSMLCGMLASIKWLMTTPVACANDSCASSSEISWSSLKSGEIIRVYTGHPWTSPNRTPQLNMLISLSDLCFRSVLKKSCLSAVSIGNYSTLSPNKEFVLSTWKWRLFMMQSAPIELYPIRSLGSFEILKSWRTRTISSSDSTCGSPSSAKRRNNEWSLQSGY